LVVDQTTKISSQNALNGNSNKTIVDFTLPEGTISWAYYIGVGNEGKAAYSAAQDKFVNSSANLLAKCGPYGVMTALALYGVNFFSKVQGVDNVKYWFISDWNSVQTFNAGGTFYQYKQGDVINDAYQMKSHLKEKIYLGLLNDNVMDPIDVLVKVTAVKVIEKWGVRDVKKMRVKSRVEAYMKD
jgi:hypothetical protein